MEKLNLEGYLFNSESHYVVIVQDDGKSVELDDTIMRSGLIGKKVEITIRSVCDETKNSGNSRS